MTTLTNDDIRSLRDSLTNECISYGEMHLIDCAADAYGIVMDENPDDPMPPEVVLDEIEAILESQEIEDWLANEPYAPTHVSLGDQSTAQLVSANPFRLRNECGDVWRDDSADWQPIS